MFTRSHAALIIGILLTVLDQTEAAAQTQPAVIKAVSVSFTDVSTAIGLAKEGDTVVVPAGSASWTSTLTITKGITLQGATTVSGPGTQSATANDATNITNNSGSGLINVRLAPSQPFRLTGFTFTKGTSQGVVVGLNGIGPGPHMKMRVDHCHFNNFNGNEAITIGGWTYGVADHNYMHTTSNTPTFFISDSAYNGGQYGHGAWADYPWYGTDKFFFIEDNTLKGDGTEPTSGNMDSQFGGRFVVRHNDMTNCRPGWHGSEGNYRGARAIEVYNNVSHWTSTPMADNRSGTALVHDNTWTGTVSDNNSHGRIEIFREWAGVGTDCPYGYADGTGPFDSNDTEGDGATYIYGHPPHLYDSGTCSSATTQQGGVGVMTDNTKNWTPNQWVGFSIKMKSGQAVPKGSYIISNTSNSISYIYYNTTDRGPLLVFQPGDTYEIHKLLIALDQGGRGKGDLLAPNSSGTGMINTKTGGNGWPNQALEPMMSWNNVDAQGTAYGFYCQFPSEKQGHDYYNLGKGLPTNGAPIQVTSVYTAALNGVDYVGPYTYPHPLTSPIAPPSNLAIVN